MAPKTAATQRKRKSAALPPPPEAMNSGEMEVISSSEDGVNSTSTASKRSRSTKATSAVPKAKQPADQPLISTSMEGADEAGEEISPKRKATAQSPTKKKKSVPDDDESDAQFLGKPFSVEEARKRWPHRFDKKDKLQTKGSRVDIDEELIEARRHYSRAKVDGFEYKLNENAHVQAEDGKENYICKIVEMFEAFDGEKYFTAQWYYRAKDTIIEDAYKIDEKRVFLSEVKNDNPLDCLVEKLNILMCPLKEDWQAKQSPVAECDYYCNALYLLPFATFIKLPSEIIDSSESSSTISQLSEVSQPNVKSDAFTLLDLYSGCGGMSTGLSLGSKLSGQEIITKWAVDLNEFACESLKLNHPETEVRNEKVDDFLTLLEEWEKLCIRFSLISNSDPEKKQSYPFDAEEEESDSSNDEEEGDDDDAPDDSECFELEKIIGICYGKPDDKPCGLYFKVQWKRYGPEYDSWEPISGLGNCLKAIREFVTDGFNRMILPLPGTADVICGGPPCQGISGFNRFRDRENPLNDEKNKQLPVFMDVVKFLRPKYVLMENVVDILKFAEGSLGRYAVGRLVEMNYQTRIGLVAAGAYGLPQYRMRAFFWGALPTQDLPPYPMPTHDVVKRGVVPTKFEACVVAFDEGSNVELKKKLLLEDALSDLPPVGNSETRDEMPYTMVPQTEFQRLIRLRTPEALDLASPTLNSHRPYECNADDYERIGHIPKKKGANFRDLPGVRVRPDKKVEFDPSMERVLLSSGKHLVPDYAMSFVKGTSSKPFGRLWWDETVPTVVTRPEPHNQVILHPNQDRVLSVRENARLQGFPDYYKLVGPIRQRYMQVGNAVAVPVSRAMGFVLGTAFQHNVDRQPLFTLPSDYLEKAHPTTPPASASSQDEA